MAILAADIGGTKTLLQLSEPVAGGVEVLYEKRYASAEYPEFMPLIEDFLHTAFAASGKRPVAACLGIAGPIKDRSSVVTNLPWIIEADALEATLGIARVSLINDFQSIGYGIAALQAEDLLPLQQGEAIEHGTRLVIGAGTGLGMGLLVWQGDHYEVIASESGHTDFAPDDALQVELQQYLKRRYVWATWERVLSGPGLINMFEFLVHEKSAPVSSDLQAALRDETDHAAVISQFGASALDSTAEQALDLFIALYGRQTGNLALLSLATGGVYIAGGIASKLSEKMRGGSFMQQFLNKEARMQPLLKAMPVNIVVNESVGLLGAALTAARLAGAEQEEQ